MEETFYTEKCLKEWEKLLGKPSDSENESSDRWFICCDIGESDDYTSISFPIKLDYSIIDN